MTSNRKTAILSKYNASCLIIDIIARIDQRKMNKSSINVFNVGILILIMTISLFKYYLMMDCVVTDGTIFATDATCLPKTKKHGQMPRYQHIFLL